jgi:hypothetical protein
MGSVDLLTSLPEFAHDLRQGPKFLPSPHTLLESEFDRPGAHERTKPRGSGPRENSGLSAGRRLPDLSRISQEARDIGLVKNVPSSCTSLAPRRGYCFLGKLTQRLYAYRCTLYSLTAANAASRRFWFIAG